MNFTNKLGETRGFKVSTLRERIKASLWTIGVAEVTELQAAWKKKFPREEFERETGRKWLVSDVEPKFLLTDKLLGLAALTGFDPNWIQTGAGEPGGLRAVGPEASELLRIFESLGPERRKNLMQNALDALTAQQASEVGNAITIKEKTKV